MEIRRRGGETMTYFPQPPVVGNVHALAEYVFRELNEIARHLQAPIHGEISVHDGATAQPGVGTTPVKMTGFDTNGDSNGVTVDSSSDTITIKVPGLYLVNFHCSFSGAANTEYQCHLTVNGTEDGLGFVQELEGGQAKSASFGGQRRFLRGDDLTIYVESDNGAGVSFTPEHAFFSVLWKGE